MNIRTILLLGIKIIALTIIMTICFMVASVIVGLSTPPPGSETPPVDTRSTLWILLLVSLMQTAILTYIILRSRWNGWKLVGAIFLAFYGLNTVVAQIESLVYLPSQLPEGMIPKLFVMGAIVAGLFAPIAVLVLGKMRQTSTTQEPNPRLVMPMGEWGWKFTLIIVAYLILYFSFGYFIAWKNPIVQAYYGGTDPDNFFAQLNQIWTTTSWMFPFQAFRALLWTAFTLPVIRMLKGPSWETGLMVALLLTVWSSQLLLPNPYMPETVAKMHFVETSLSNFIFGWIMGWLMSR